MPRDSGLDAQARATVGATKMNRGPTSTFTSRSAPKVRCTFGGQKKMILQSKPHNMIS